MTKLELKTTTHDAIERLKADLQAARREASNARQAIFTAELAKDKLEYLDRHAEYLYTELAQYDPLTFAVHEVKRLSAELEASQKRTAELEARVTALEARQ